MTKIKNAPLKNANAKTPVIKVNLDKFAKDLANHDIKVKAKKETLYIYPEGFGEHEINSEKGKKFRNSLRTRLKRHCNNILSYAKTQQPEPLAKEIKEFMAWYKTAYRNNDLSFASLSQSKNESKEKDLVIMLNIIKEMQGVK